RSRSATCLRGRTRSKPGTRNSARRSRRSPWVPVKPRPLTSPSAHQRPDMQTALSWMLPPSASTFGGEIDWLYYLILAVTGIAFVAVEIALVVFLFRYRGRPGRKATYVHGSTRAEIIWTGVTTVVVVIIGLLSAPAWGRIKGRHSVPADALPLGIHAKQFEWHVTYPGKDGAVGTSDDYTIRGQIHVPVNRPIVATLTAEDVIHSFLVPAFRIKQDAVPGMQIRV